MRDISGYTLLVFDWEGTLMNEGEPFPGIHAVLSELQSSGYLLAIATGKSKRGLEADLSRFDLTSYFQSYRCGDEGHSKPHPDMLLYLLETHGISNKEALVIGDTETDLYMAQAAQVDCLAVTYGFDSKETLLSMNPRGYIDDIIDLPAWLAKNPPEPL